MLIVATYFPDVPFCPWFFGSDSCEVLFSYICAFTKGKNNLSFLEMLDITGRVIRLMEIKHKGRINKVVKVLEVSWPTNLQQEIVEGMKTANKEVLKKMEGIGMIPGLRAANVVFQNQRTGDLFLLNSATTAFVSETSIFSDEQNIAAFDEWI